MSGDRWTDCPDGPSNIVAGPPVVQLDNGGLLFCRYRVPGMVPGEGRFSRGPERGYVAASISLLCVGVRKRWEDSEGRPVAYGSGARSRVQLLAAPIEEPERRFILTASGLASDSLIGAWEALQRRSWDAQQRTQRRFPSWAWKLVATGEPLATGQAGGKSFTYRPWRLGCAEDNEHAYSGHETVRTIAVSYDADRAWCDEWRAG